MNRISVKLIPGALVLALLVSCGKDPNKPGLEFMPDMYRSPSYETYAPNPLFADSTSARQPVAGTVPRGYAFFTYPATMEGYQAAGRDLVNPFPADTIILAEGKRLYTNFCMHCHGETGGGDGSLIATGKFPPPPSYTAGVSSRGGNMRDLTDGKIYHTITHGVNLMGPHASQLNPDERWKIVMYVKELMKSGAPAAAADTTAAPKDSTVAMNK
jgi:mono/diheme cytochrome c family protein